MEEVLIDALEYLYNSDNLSRLEEEEGHRRNRLYEILSEEK